MVSSYSPTNTTKVKTYRLKMPFIEWSLAVIAILAMNPYFVWKTFHNGILFGNVITTNTILMIICIAIFFALLVMKHIPISMKDPRLGISLATVVIGFYICFINGNGIDIVPARILPYIAIALFVLMPMQFQARVFKTFTIIFAILLIPAIIYWILGTLGFDIKYTILAPDNLIRVNAGIYYKQYFLAVEHIPGVEQSITRLTGIFDEPGVVGTFSGLLLGATRFKFKKNWVNVVILIGGFLSFSLAFYSLCLIFIILNSFKHSGVKVFITMAVILLAYITFISIEFNDPFFASLQNRLTIEDGFWTGDNRTAQSFDIGYDFFLKQGGSNLWFGNGVYTSSRNELLAGGSSYKMLIYDNGIIGFALIIIWNVLACVGLRKANRSKDWYSLFLMIMFLASIYQRPYTFTIPHIVILFGGIAYLTGLDKLEQIRNLKVNV